MNSKKCNTGVKKMKLNSYQDGSKKIKSDYENQKWATDQYSKSLTDVVKKNKAIHANDSAYHAETGNNITSAYNVNRYTGTTPKGGVTTNDGITEYSNGRAYRHSDGAKGKIINTTNRSYSDGKPVIKPEYQWDSYDESAVKKPKKYQDGGKVVVKKTTKPESMEVALLKQNVDLARAVKNNKNTPTGKPMYQDAVRKEAQRRITNDSTQLAKKGYPKYTAGTKAIDSEEDTRSVAEKTKDWQAKHMEERLNSNSSDKLTNISRENRPAYLQAVASKMKAEGSLDKPKQGESYSETMARSYAKGSYLGSPKAKSDTVITKSATNVSGGKAAPKPIPVRKEQPTVQKMNLRTTSVENPKLDTGSVAEVKEISTPTSNTVVASKKPSLFQRMKTRQDEGNAYAASIDAEDEATSAAENLKRMSQPEMEKKDYSTPDIAPRMNTKPNLNIVRAKDFSHVGAQEGYEASLKARKENEDARSSYESNQARVAGESAREAYEGKQAATRADNEKYRDAYEAGKPFAEVDKPVSKTQSNGLARGGTEAVAAWQRKRGLKADGAWGAETQKAYEREQASKAPKKMAISKTNTPTGTKTQVDTKTATDKPFKVTTKNGITNAAFDPKKLHKPTTVDRGSVDNDAARRAEYLYPDPEMHGSRVNTREQAQRLVDIDKKGEESVYSTAAKIGVPTALAGALAYGAYKNKKNISKSARAFGSKFSDALDMEGTAPYKTYRRAIDIKDATAARKAYEALPDVDKFKGKTAIVKKPDIYTAKKTKDALELISNPDNNRRPSNKTPQGQMEINSSVFNEKAKIEGAGVASPKKMNLTSSNKASTFTDKSGKQYNVISNANNKVTFKDANNKTYTVDRSKLNDAYKQGRIQTGSKTSAPKQTPAASNSGETYQEERIRLARERATASKGTTAPAPTPSKSTSTSKAPASTTPSKTTTTSASKTTSTTKKGSSKAAPVAAKETVVETPKAEVKETKKMGVGKNKKAAATTEVVVEDKPKKNKSSKTVASNKGKGKGKGKKANTSELRDDSYFYDYDEEPPF